MKRSLIAILGLLFVAGLAVASPRSTPRPVHAEFSPLLHRMWVRFSQPIYLSSVMPEYTTEFTRQDDSYLVWNAATTLSVSPDGRTLTVQFSGPAEGPCPEVPTCSYAGGGLLLYGQGQHVPSWSNIICRDAE